jgi:polar amino acid transport system substrate-binding protein
VEALRAGKSVFVEKPLALNELELAEVEAAAAGGAVLMVGFNRRWAPLTEVLRSRLAGDSGAALLARVNAGPLPADHWLNDLEIGGGRLIGEGCHFVDLLAHLAGSEPVSVHAVGAPAPGRPIESSESVTGTLRFRSGAVGTLVYSGAGDSGMPKERVEAFGRGLSAVLDDFRRLELYEGGRRSVTKGAQDKGHAREVECFVEAAAGRVEPPGARTFLTSTRATLALAESLRTGLPVEVGA